MGISNSKLRTILRRFSDRQDHPELIRAVETEESERNMAWVKKRL